jgi:membrane-associated phospholipid phosphatase
MTDPWRNLCLASLAVALILSAAALVWGVLDGEAAVREALLARTSPTVRDVVRWVNYGGTWRVLLPAALMLFGAVRGARRRWWLWAAVLVVAPVLDEGWQEIVARPRPEASALGFPSGHATAAASFAVMVIYLTHRARPARVWRLTLSTLVALAALAVGLARVILHAHWPGDVVTGFALGSACAAAGAWWDSSHPLTPRLRETNAQQSAIQHSRVGVVTRDRPDGAA